jgi:hypothetical protein
MPTSYGLNPFTAEIAEDAMKKRDKKGIGRYGESRDRSITGR